MEELKVKALILDWAGTMIDYGSFSPVNVFLSVFLKKGIEITVEEARKPMGMLKYDHIKEILTFPRVKDTWVKKYGREPEKKDIDELYENFEPAVLEIIDKYSKPFSNNAEVIKELQDKGFKIGSTTGYTKNMMDIVTKVAEDNGYKPDFWITPDLAGNYGRPYPYMIFQNLINLEIMNVKEAVKIGDTIVDIEEGRNAGVWSIGVIEGSSLLGLLEEEFNNLPAEEKKDLRIKVKNEFFKAGAHYVINNLSEMFNIIDLIDMRLGKMTTDRTSE